MSNTNEYLLRSAIADVRTGLDERIALVQTAIDALLAVQQGAVIPGDCPGTSRPEAFHDIYAWAYHCIDSGLPHRNELQKLRARL